MGSNPHLRSNKATVAQQQIRCYELRLAGHSIRAIAATVGLSPATVHTRIQSEINARVTPLADELRQMELDRLDRWLVRLDEQIAAGRATARNIEVALKVSERRARLCGLDAPVQARVETVTLDMVDREIERLTAELEAQGGGTAAGIINERFDKIEAEHLAELAGLRHRGGQ